ncbi:uncharacterized protein [Triticum aestivum]|uniref:uncharacterized protein n=1 Tax=Triticum aestivum TaxID=4565 RepID=UPI001D00D619|nr:uncharacterized protein LOC123153629 [Triticum aestivum]
MRTSGTIQWLTSHPRATWTLRARFRRESPALNDARCGDLRPGDQLCLACDIYGDADELKYYTLSLRHNRHRPNMQVEKAAHGTVDGVERCACRFTVRWTEGPRCRCQDKVGVEVVCFVQESPIQDPVLTEFLDGVRNRFGEDQGGATVASQQAVPTRTPSGSRRSSTSKYFVGIKFALGEHSHLDGFKCFKEVLDKDNRWRKSYARHNRREITSICMPYCNPRAISYYREKEYFFP